VLLLGARIGNIEMELSYKTTGYPFKEEEFKFETYRFYLHCIMKYLTATYGDWQLFAGQAINIAGKFKKLPNCDNTHLERYLKIAWNTEYLACENQSSDVHIIRINNQWKPIQIYYAIYAAGETLSYLIDGSKSNGHKKCLRKLSDFFVNHGLSPWNYAYDGYRGKSNNSHFSVNFPQKLVIPDSNLQRRGIQPIQMIAKCLKAEHYHRVDDDFQKRKGVYKYKFNPHYTTILHFLYRLRIKSNYKDADIFLAEAPYRIIQEFSNDLSNFCFWTLLLFEIYIIQKCTKSCFMQLFKNYEKINPNITKLKQRIEFYENNIK